MTQALNYLTSLTNIVIFKLLLAAVIAIPQYVRILYHNKLCSLMHRMQPS